MPVNTPFVVCRLPRHGVDEPIDSNQGIGLFYKMKYDSANGG
jgi:hypothetical protein